MEGKSLVDHHRAQIRIQHRRTQRILGTADDHWLIDELVLRPTKAAPFHADPWPPLGRSAGDDQHLEVRQYPLLPAQRRRQDVGHCTGYFAMRIPVSGMLPE